MKNIYFLIGTLSTGGAERVVSNLSLGLEGKEVHIILFGNYEIEYPYRGEVISLDEHKETSYFSKIKNFFSRLYKLRKLKKERDGVFISFLEYPNILNILSGKSDKTIVSVRNHMTSKHKEGLKSVIWKKTIKYLYPKADLIIAVSKEIKQDLVANFDIKEQMIKVIYNPYNLEKIKLLSREKNNSQWTDIFINPTVITAGRLEYQKGQWHLIKAFYEVLKEIPDAKLVILGEGRLKSDLEKLVDDLEMKNSVYFLGFQENPFKFFRKSKVFALTSLYEGFPNALSEAMACGLPVISTDCLSGPREILAPKESMHENIDYGLQANRHGVLLSNFDETMDFNPQNICEKEKELANYLIMFLREDQIRTQYSIESYTRIKDFDVKKIIFEWERVL